MKDASLSEQVSRLVAENRSLRIKGDADDKAIHLMQEQYDILQSGVESLVEDHRKIERELTAERDRAMRAYARIDGLLNQTADLVLQAMRAKIGNATPDPLPKASTPHLVDDRMPQVLLS